MPREDAAGLEQKCPLVAAIEMLTRISTDTRIFIAHIVYALPVHTQSSLGSKGLMKIGRYYLIVSILGSKCLAHFTAAFFVFVTFAGFIDIQFLGR